MRIISDNEVKQLLAVMGNNDLSVSQVLELIERRNRVVDITALEIELTVDYGKSVEQAIAEGKYDRVDSDINAHHFPIDQELVGKIVKVKAKLFNFPCELVSEQVIVRMNQAAYRPANLMETLAFGAARPELQRIIFIKALGSYWEDNDGYYNVPALHTDENKRYLSTVLFAHMFSTRHFALGIVQAALK